jgi:2-iminobutanoate/2-iminopropanoate deaminase
MAPTSNTVRREVYNVAEMPQPKGYKSMAVRGGDLIFVSGQIGKGDDGRPLDTVEEQAAAAFRQMRAILMAAGSSMDNVVKISILVTDAEYLTRIQDVKREFFPNDPPASLGAIVKGLALGAKIEIDAIATAND